MSLTSKKLAEIILAIVAIALIVGVVLCFTTPLGDAFSGILAKQHEVANGDIWQEGNYDMPYTVKLTTNDPNMGTAAFAGEYDGLTSVSLKGEQAVTVKATPSGGYEFIGWYEGDTKISENAEYSFLATGNANIEARFEEHIEAFTVDSTNRAKIGYTGAEGENLVIPEKFQDTDGTWYKVTAIGQSAFSGCTGLTSVEIPASVTSIGESAFAECAGLTSVTFADNSQLTSIGTYAFGWCNSLTEIAIPDSVTQIGYGAFLWCIGLSSITIPEGVSSIGDCAFNGCTGLEEIYFNAIAMSDPSGNLVTSIFGRSGTAGSGTHIVIGANVTRIPKQLFNANSNSAHKIVSVEFEEGSVCESIGSSAFAKCTGLTSVAIPDSVTSIGNSAFSDCTGLTSVEIPDSVTNISESAFARCSKLTSITIPGSVTSVGNFAFSGCTGLTSVTIHSETMVTYSTYMLKNCSSLTTIYVPADLVDDYQAASGWSNFSSKIQAIGGVSAS